MRFLIVGLGSMGKRRIRCLQSLGYANEQIAAFDVREDRRTEAAGLYQVPVYSDIRTALRQQPDMMIISVPPDVHHEYMQLALDERIPFFVEASVVDTNMESLIEQANRQKLLAAPSATMLFHPAIQEIKRIVQSGGLGIISNFTFHSGQYLPDWHTYEKVSDYYVSNKATGGAREIVPFELTWLVEVFGFPQKVHGHVRKTIPIEGAPEIDDTYNILLDFGTGLGSMTVDVVSRSGTRRLVVNGSDKQLVWDWNEHCIKLYHPAEGRWETIGYEMISAASGYNSNIGENMYIEELGRFIESYRNGSPFVNSLEKDHRVLKLLYAIEASEHNSSSGKV